MNFNNLQPIIWDRLRRAKSNEKIGTAYLFSGPRGSGKEWGAIEFAKFLNCENQGELSCNHCSSCLKFLGLQHPNLKLVVPLPGSAKSTQSSNPLDTLKNEDLEYLTNAIAEKGKNPFYKINVPGSRKITINAIRELRKSIYLKSQSGGRKIILIFDAHLLSEGMGESANALLKILEEPPKDSTLILVSDKKSGLLPTIISRCQPIYFSPLNLDIARSILEQEGLENQKATELAILARGDIHLAKELHDKSRGDLFSEIKDLVQLIIKVDAKGWGDFINGHSMLAAQKPDQFKFNLFLLQIWFHNAYELKCGISENIFFQGMTLTLEDFNQTYPKANLSDINMLLENTIESLVRNLYVPLTLTNLLIAIQELLKGKIPRSA